MKKIKILTRLLLSLLIVSGLIAACTMRSNALLFFLQELSFDEQLLSALPSIFFYFGLLVWFFALERTWARYSLAKHFLLGLYMLLVVAFDMFSSFALKWEAGGMNLFAFYYWLTQFGVLHSEYFIFKLIVYVFFAGSFGLISLLGFMFCIKQRKHTALLLLGLSVLLLGASFSTYGEKVRKDISLSSLSYTLNSMHKTPREADFSSLDDLLVAPFEIDLQGAMKKNVVIIVLESTRKDALNFYNKELTIETPFWSELAAESQVFTNVYATIPSTIKALSSINCGVVPYLNFPILESVYGLPNDCLAKSFSGKDYDTLFMQSAKNDYGNKSALAYQWGFEDFISAEHLNVEGYKSNPFGYGDHAMLDTNRQWLEKRKKPFFTMYLTLGPHWPYNLYDDTAKEYVETHLEESYSASNEKYPIDGTAHLRPKYLKTVVHQDAFLRELIAQFKETGHYNNTVFILVSDHGVVLGDRQQYLRANSMFQEVINVPFMVHVPWQKTTANVSDALLSQTDIPQIIGNILQDRDILEDIDNETVFSSCWFWKWCIARVDKQYKYIHNFDSIEDELYDLQHDPKEQNNIISEHAELAERYKEESLAWFQQQLALYGQLYGQHDKQFYLRGHPRLDTIQLGD